MIFLRWKSCEEIYPIATSNFLKILLLSKEGEITFKIFLYKKSSKLLKFSGCIEGNWPQDFCEEGKILYMNYCVWRHSKLSLTDGLTDLQWRKQGWDKKEVRRLAIQSTQCHNTSVLYIIIIIIKYCINYKMIQQKNMQPKH